MGILKRFLWIAPALLLGAGCGKSTTVTAPTSSTTNSAVSSNAFPELPAITNAQPKLRTIKLWLGPHEVEAEMALTTEAIRTGMMFRTNLNEMAGMLFVFGSPRQVGFWMQNTTVPLDVGYIDANGVLQEIYPLEPLNTEPVESGSGNIQFVLEMNQGWFDRHNVSTGTLVITEHGPLNQVFAPRRSR